MSSRKRASTTRPSIASKLRKKIEKTHGVDDNADCEKTKQVTITETVTSSSNHDVKALDFSFYDQPCEDLAKALLGKKLVRLAENGTRLCGIIVETEAYLGHPDKAAHSYKGETKKNEAMFMDPGTAYVYHIHSYCCMNISSKGKGAAVLLRALEPIENISGMEKHRQKRAPGKSLKKHELCNGPSKLCLSLNIEKDQINKEDMTKTSKIWLENGEEKIDPKDIISCKRININYAEEWIDKPLRFYIAGNKCVSKRDKDAEKT